METIVMAGMGMGVGNRGGYNYNVENDGGYVGRG